MYKEWYQMDRLFNIWIKGYANHIQDIFVRNKVRWLYGILIKGTSLLQLHNKHLRSSQLW